MKLYLIQHADAKSKKEDPSRPLTDKGWDDIRRVAKFAEKHLLIQVEEIIHSGKLRAKQTADVLAEHLKPTRGIISYKDLEPLADPRIWKNRLAETAGNIMIVGHLPHLGKLTGLLLTGDASKEVVRFRTGSIVSLERGEGSRWTIQSMITPEILFRESS